MNSIFAWTNAIKKLSGAEVVADRSVRLHRTAWHWNGDMAPPTYCRKRAPDRQVLCTTYFTSKKSLHFTWIQLILPKKKPKGMEKKQNKDSPILQLVMMLSSVNSNQHNGSASTLLFSTGGNIAVRALGSTGCMIELPVASSPSAWSEEIFELDRKRVVVAWLSAR